MKILQVQLDPKDKKSVYQFMFSCETFHELSVGYPVTVFFIKPDVVSGMTPFFMIGLKLTGTFVVSYSGLDIDPYKERIKERFQIEGNKINPQLYKDYFITTESK